MCVTVRHPTTAWNELDCKLTDQSLNLINPQCSCLVKFIRNAIH